MTDGKIVRTGAGREFEFCIKRKLAPDDIEFLTGTVWGSRDLQYRIPDLGDRLRRLRSPRIFVLTENERLASICILDRCRKRALGRDIDAFHAVMVATREDVRNEGLGGCLIDEVRGFCDRELERPGIGFAYVESTTVFTLRISEHVGHALEAEMPLTVFSRLWPSDHPDADWARAEDRAEIVSRLGDLYADHEFTDFDASVDHARTLVLRQNGRIVAGLQVEELVWSLLSLPGLTGRLLLRAMPWIPFMRGRLNPRRLPLLKFANVLVEPGHEASFKHLMNSALLRHNASLAMLLLDRRSPVLHRIRAQGGFGLLSNAVAGAAQMHLDFWGMTDGEIAEISHRPLLVSAADIF